LLIIPECAETDEDIIIRIYSGIVFKQAIKVFTPAKNIGLRQAKIGTLG